MGSEITYSETVRVYVGGSRVGTIVPVLNGWRYIPKGGSSPGVTLPTVAAVKRSLETETIHGK